MIKQIVPQVVKSQNLDGFKRQMVQLSIRVAGSIQLLITEQINLTIQQV